MPSARRPPRSKTAPGGAARRKVNAVRQQAAAEPNRSRSGLTTRAAVLGLVLCALVVSAALPLREYLGQRGQIVAAQQKKAQHEARVKALEAQLRQWNDPAYVAAQARSRLHFVLPGETSYVLLTPSAAPEATEQRPGARATGPEAPWYSQVWGSVQAADRPVPTATPTP